MTSQSPQTPNPCSEVRIWLRKSRRHKAAARAHCSGFEFSLSSTHGSPFPGFQLQSLCLQKSTRARVPPGKGSLPGWARSAQSSPAVPVGSSCLFHRSSGAVAPTLWQGGLGGKLSRSPTPSPRKRPPSLNLRPFSRAGSPASTGRVGLPVRPAFSLPAALGERWKTACSRSGENDCLLRAGGGWGGRRPG